MAADLARFEKSVSEYASGVEHLAENFLSVSSAMSDLKKVWSDLEASVELLTQGMQVLLADRAHSNNNLGSSTSTDSSFAADSTSNQIIDIASAKSVPRVVTEKDDIEESSLFRAKSGKEWKCTSAICKGPKSVEFNCWFSDPSMLLRSSLKAATVFTRFETLSGAGSSGLHVNPDALSTCSPAINFQTMNPSLIVTCSLVELHGWPPPAGYSYPKYGFGWQINFTVARLYTDVEIIGSSIFPCGLVFLHIGHWQASLGFANSDFPCDHSQHMVVLMSLVRHLLWHCPTQNWAPVVSDIVATVGVIFGWFCGFNLAVHFDGYCPMEVYKLYALISSTAVSTISFPEALFVIQDASVVSKCQLAIRAASVTQSLGVISVSTSVASLTPAVIRCFLNIVTLGAGRMPCGSTILRSRYGLANNCASCVIPGKNAEMNTLLNSSLGRRDDRTDPRAAKALHVLVDLIAILFEQTMEKREMQFSPSKSHYESAHASAQVNFMGVARYNGWLRGVYTTLPPRGVDFSDYPDHKAVLETFPSFEFALVLQKYFMLGWSGHLAKMGAVHLSAYYIFQAEILVTIESVSCQLVIPIFLKDMWQYKMEHNLLTGTTASELLRSNHCISWLLHSRPFFDVHDIVTFYQILADPILTSISAIQCLYVYGVLTFLHELVEQSFIMQILEQDTYGYQYSDGSNVLEVLRYFSMVRLLRVSCLFGDYHFALNVNIKGSLLDNSPTLLFRRAVEVTVSCLVALIQVETVHCALSSAGGTSTQTLWEIALAFNNLSTLWRNFLVAASENCRYFVDGNSIVKPSSNGSHFTWSTMTGCAGSQLLFLPVTFVDSRGKNMMLQQLVLEYDYRKVSNQQEWEALLVSNSTLLEWIWHRAWTTKFFLKANSYRFSSDSLPTVFEPNTSGKFYDSSTQWELENVQSMSKARKTMVTHRSLRLLVQQIHCSCTTQESSFLQVLQQLVCETVSVVLCVTTKGAELQLLGFISEFKYFIAAVASAYILDQLVIPLPRHADRIEYLDKHPKFKVQGTINNKLGGILLRPITVAPYHLQGSNNFPCGIVGFLLGICLLQQVNMVYYSQWSDHLTADRVYYSQWSLLVALVLCRIAWTLVNYTLDYFGVLFS